MPAANIEQLKQREASLKKRISAQGESADRVERRALGKKLRRAQRKRRKLVIEAARKAGKPEPAPEAAAAEAAPAEESPEAKQE
jgi:hypothetical protein